MKRPLKKKTPEGLTADLTARLITMGLGYRLGLEGLKVEAMDEMRKGVLKHRDSKTCDESEIILIEISELCLKLGWLHGNKAMHEGITGEASTS